ncbi:E1-E2 ATPase family protein (macronuclear) [Tetrahymena thermophila SB210]|uniref:E1-E2 ATPase family protein n=1 Tax=Tetrahymena thermophila (strain SB210) TaxID=312017 RepID=W7XJ80_TETTS|nr:E1-E2 ATPase family protein [Tetrahymena thermophila SB210]EWS75286.1 E1-E2 ATPase family protein [Tetrahymena thermophila SB210]|eukprot:XP_012652277.1 E1-E2 ATPase family protein [Tetrahymena thermophila SB210]
MSKISSEAPNKANPIPLIELFSDCKTINNELHKTPDKLQAIPLNIRLINTTEQKKSKAQSNYLVGRNNYQQQKYTQYT